MAVCRTSAENIKIDPCYVTWEQQNTFTVACEADNAGSLDEKYFIFGAPGLDFFVWFNGGGTAPVVSGATAIPVVFTDNATATTIASALATAVNANANLHAVVSACDPTLVYIQAKEAGAPPTAAADSDTGFVITTIRTGARLEVGFIDGDIELGLTENLVDVTSHQTGGQVIGSLRSGRNIENISISMKEADAAKMKQIIEASGVEFTPVEVGATAVSAWGSEDSKSFANILSNCRKLVLHPVAKSDTDYSEDFCFPRAYPLLTGLVISGENPRLMNVEFKILPDGILAKEVRVFIKGDHTQNFLDQ